MTSKVVAVVVTHNRLPLLKEAIAAINAQTMQAAELIVVNNASSDGTTEWLNEQTQLTVINQENTGGSGGFYTGIKEAVKNGADWVWLMDDDTICLPGTLEKLLNKLPLLAGHEPGFVCSKVIWKDGSPHLMNLPGIQVFSKSLPFNTYDQHNITLVDKCSFVSVLVSAVAVEKVGLPYKDFYIWSDDLEYTQRITKSGLLGMYCADSIVLHKTPANHRAYIYTESPANLWKYKYGIRNELFLVRKRKGLFYYIIYTVARVCYNCFLVVKIRKTDRLQFIKTICAAAWSSLFFHPKIDRV